MNTTSSRYSSVVIGVGNSSRRDDGAGRHFVRTLRERLGDASDVRVVESDGDPAELLELWTGAPVAIVVDASSSRARPGTVTELDGAKGSNGFGLRHSTHAMGVIEAVQLGKALGRMPSRLRIFGIEGEDFSFGEGLTPAVESAVAGLVERVIREERLQEA
jgi:hydrogenase maturation protease